MRMLRQPWWRAGPDERGAAMITVVSIVAVLGALTATIAAVGVTNLRNADRDRQAGAALGASDAGVAQAIEYIRNNGVGVLNCPVSNPSSCASSTNPWTNPTSPALVPLDPGATTCGETNNCAKVWIGWVRQYAPPTVKTGVYRIHSLGIYGRGPGARRVVVDVEAKPMSFPVGVFGHSLSGNGGTRIYSESLFTTDCISPRWNGSGNGTRFDNNIDPYWGIPAAAHTTSHISTANNCGARGYIHSSAQPCPNNDAMNYDQSGDGGPVGPGSPCYRSYLQADGTYYPAGDTTRFTVADLQRYGYRPRGLADSEYAALKSRAQAQGLYNVSPGSLSATITGLLANGVNQPVVFWDEGYAGTVNLSDGDFPAGAFNRSPNSPCTTTRSVLVVREHGDMTFQGGNSSWFNGSFFVPDGDWTGNGGYNILGTLFAQNLSLGGNEQWQLDSCYVQNLPGGILTLTTLSFREDDMTDLP